jgi:hypothetical protein
MAEYTVSSAGWLIAMTGEVDARSSSVPMGVIPSGRLSLTQPQLSVLLEESIAKKRALPERVD